jgi:hypothetical protein
MPGVPLRAVPLSSSADAQDAAIQLSRPEAVAIRSQATRRRSVAVANEMRKKGARPKADPGTTATFASSSRKVAKSTSL